MKILLSILLLTTNVIIFTGSGLSQNFNKKKDIDTITQRLVRQELESAKEVIDISELLKSMLDDGTWSDIVYAQDTEDFPAGLHLERLREMAREYVKQGGKYYGSNELFKKIKLGYDGFLLKAPTSKNWWFNQIGGPEAYLAGLLLLKGKMDKETLIHYSAYLKDLTDNSSHQGMNRIWVSAITIGKGCLEDDYALINKGFNSVASTLVISDEQGIEGIKIDNSFHQHRAQLYSGGYGKGFAENTATLIALSANTHFRSLFSEERIKIFSNMLLNGLQLLSYHNTVDFGTIGRNISRPNGLQTLSVGTLDQMMIIDPIHAQTYKAWKIHLQGGNFPSIFTGNKYFWKSDIMTYHGPDYYLSAKVISTRTTGTEMLNGENLKGYNLPLGATNILISGEEYRDIFPVWDWTRVPGTTGILNQSTTILPWYLFGSNQFAGGVSDGEKGMIAYEHNYNGVQAQKAYFFVDDQMLCLGAGISAMKTQQVITSVNQCFWKGDIFVGLENSPAENKFTDSIKNFKQKELSWVYHNGVGYVFPKGGDITLQATIQSGTWKSIDNNGSDELIRQPVFSIWLNHSTSPLQESYCYEVKPAKSIAEFKSKIAAPSFVIINNDKSTQVVKYQNTYFIIFYEPGNVKLENGLEILAQDKLMLMLEEKEDGYQIAVADPVHKLKQTNISINENLSGEGTTHPKENSTTIKLNLPTGDYQGKTIIRSYKKQPV